MQASSSDLQAQTWLLKSVNIQLRRNSFEWQFGANKHSQFSTPAQPESSDTERSHLHFCFQHRHHSALFSRPQYPSGCAPTLGLLWWSTLYSLKFFMKSHGSHTNPSSLKLHTTWTPQKLNISYSWSCESSIHACQEPEVSLGCSGLNNSVGRNLLHFCKCKETAETGNELGVNYLSGLNASKKVERGLSGNSTFWKSQQSRKCCKCHMIILEL